jgi:hypothetical protein
MDDAPLFIDCSSHQRQRAAVLCQHLASPTAASLGFVENSTDPDDLQAWCSACEALFSAEGGMTPAFQEHHGMCVVCVHCYESARRANARSV